MYEQPYNPYSSNVSIIKRYFKSGTVLTLSILYLISAVINIWSAIEYAGNDPLTYGVRLFNQLSSEFGVSTGSGDLYSFINDASALRMTVNIVSVGLVPLLCALAFFLIFVLSASESDTTDPGAGLMILRVLATISYIVTLVTVILIGALYALILITVIIEASRSGSDVLNAALITLIVIGVVLSIVGSIVVSYTASRKNFYRAAQYSLRSQNLYKKGAGKFGVYSIILAVFYLISLLRTLAFPELLSKYLGVDVTVSAFTYLPDILNIAILILTAVLALGYKSYINRQIHGYNPAPYGEPPRDYYPPEPEDAYQMPFYDDRPNSAYDDDFDDRRYH